jgi:YD repeat-containing protein
MLLGLRLCVVAIILAFVSSPAYAQSYQYDERGRLIRATYSDCSTIRYFYDASGNRTERIVLAGDGSCAGNQAPVVVDDVITMAPGAMGLFNLLGANGGAADSDPNGDVIRLVSVTQGMLPPTPSGALSVQIQSDREHVRIVAPAAEGAYQFSYVIEDALGLTDLGSVIVTVSGASDGPEPGIVDPSLLARDDSGYFFNSASNPRVFSDLLANDIHDASAYIASVQNLSTGTVSVLADGRTVEHRASAHASGQHSYEYTLTDDSGATSTARVEFYINGINTFPGGPKVIRYTAPYPQPLVTINLLEDFSDPDGDTIVISDLHLLIGPNDIEPSHAEWRTLDGSGSWLPSGAFVQFDDTTLYYSPPQTLVATLQENFHFYIFDGHTRSNGARVEITLDVPNEAPVAVDDAVGFGPGQSGEIWVLANDTDYNDDDLTIAAVSTPSQGGIASISGDGQRILFQASDGSTDQFTYTVADPNGETDTAMVDIIIQAQPVAGDDTLVIVANTETDIDVLANDSDPDGDPIQLKSLSQPANSAALLSADLTTIRYQAGDVLGEDSFSYTITDDQLGEATAIVSVLVHAAPVTVDDAITVNLGSTVDFDVLANDNDPDGGELTITAISSADAHGTASIAADGKTITYLADTLGVEAIAYTIRDTLGGTATGQANMTINALPQANPDAVVFGLWGRTTPINPLQNDMDADGDELTITAITQPDNGDSATIAADGQSIHYNPLTTPADGAMTYTVSDGRGGFATGAIALLANSPPSCSG